MFDDFFRNRHCCTYYSHTCGCATVVHRYVYFAEQAKAAGVLFISDSPEAHLETLGPESE